MIARVEHEMNLNWAVEHEIDLNWAEQVPDLFTKAVVEFQNQYSTPDWKITIDMSRNRFVKLIATRVFND